MILEIDNVELYFSQKRILNGIYLKAEIGKITGILGSNGCGKSCLLDIIFGNQKSKYKLIRIDNKPVLKPLYQTRLVKYLPQYSILPKGLKLITIFRLYDVNWNEFITLFDAFSNYKTSKPYKLSGGEKRLVELYLVLKSSGKIILLDEPFSHLAPIHIEKITPLIHTEKQTKAIIITDHMYNHIINVSDSIYLLKNGCTKHIRNINELEDYNYLNLDTLI